VQFVNDVGQDLSVGAGAFVFFRNSQCNRYNLAKSVKNLQKFFEENRKKLPCADMPAKSHLKAVSPYTRRSAMESILFSASKPCWNSVTPSSTGVHV
jgi:hypothetical protein